jgi:hypothetical protein
MKKLKLLFFFAVVVILNSSAYSISAVGFSQWGYVNANVVVGSTSKVEVKAISDRTIGNETTATATLAVVPPVTIHAYSNDMDEKQTDSWTQDPWGNPGPYIEYDLISYGTGLAQLNIYE